MKQLAVLFISFFIGFSTWGQNTNKKYVIVPLKFYKFDKIDIYGLSSTTTKLFVEDGYTVLTDSKQAWPEELKKNPCKAIYTQTNDISPLLGLTKVELVVMDCYQNILYKAQGKDNDADEIIALREALREAYTALKEEGGMVRFFSNLPKDTDNSQSIPLTQLEATATPLPSPKVQKKPHFPTAQKPNAVVKLLQDRWKKEEPIGIEGIYKANDKVYYILYDDKSELGGFWLYKMNEMTPIAKLTTTSAPKIYKTYWANGGFDIAYQNEEQKLIIEETISNKTTLLELSKKWEE